MSCQIAAPISALGISDDGRAAMDAISSLLTGLFVYSASLRAQQQRPGEAALQGIIQLLSGFVAEMQSHSLNL